MRLIIILFIVLIVLAAGGLSGGGSIFTGTLTSLLGIPGFEQNLGGLQGGNTASSSATTASGQCCDSGNGDNCHPDNSKTLTFNNLQTHQPEQYGLLKSNVKLTEGGYHLKDSGQTFNGNQIIVNDTDTWHAGDECNGNPNNMDQIYNVKGGPSVVPDQCFTIPNDEIIYVCTSNCASGSPLVGPGPQGQVLSEGQYGSDKTMYDIYFKLSDYPTPGVPDPIKNCVQGSVNQNNTNGSFIKQQIVITPGPSQQKLQLKTFKIVNVYESSGSTSWISPYCKPAVYLYPLHDTFINVQAHPIDGFTYTIPQYPDGGWNVLAQPDGTIHSGGYTYDYLYYETNIPDTKLSIPTSGYVVSYGNLSLFFQTTLPKTGLNSHETSQFATYWLHALPKVPYYFIGVIPQSTLDAVDPLQISPSPDTLIRVTLYFKPLDTSLQVSQPHLTPLPRSGFTAVEWGGVYKKDPHHNFSCFM